MTNGKWFTSTELEQGYNVSKRLTYSWFSLLEHVGLARRAPGGKHGILLFLPGARDYLVARKRHYGKPRKKPNDAELVILKQAIEDELTVEELAVALRASITQTENWLRDFTTVN